MNKQQLTKAAKTLWYGVFEDAFGGRKRGPFQLTRRQMTEILGDEYRLDQDLVRRFQTVCMDQGMYVADLDRCFVCLDLSDVTGKRTVPSEIFATHFPDAADFDDDDNDDDAEDDEYPAIMRRHLVEDDEEVVPRQTQAADEYEDID
jgi:hypothetical protein